ncbi:unnamed protein product [Rotaria socialis]|uniref:F-box domain-containing protein n=1 Tax=Rotaria socialis TaxID=392032 RepID=A0A817XT23_9BILA|nr:unnamed protein product [Rotaria socialis]
MSLLNFPVELLHHILDYCDAHTIIFSVRCACKQLYAISNSYGSHQLKYDSKLKSSFNTIYNIVRPENVVSLIIINDHKKSNEVNPLISNFPVCKFTRLRTLTLHNFNDTELQHFLQSIKTDFLVSLSVISSERDHTQAWLLILSTVARSKIRTLMILNYLRATMENISWPIEYKLEHLSIDNCTFSNYCAILHHWPRLQTFVMKDCTMDHVDDKIFSSPASTQCSLLKSLAITQCSLPMKHLEKLLSLTSTLVQLKLWFYECGSNILSNGYDWTHLIKTKLPILDRFEFFFSNSTGFHRNTNSTSLAFLIDSFRTSFWLEEKKWFFACDYEFRPHKIRIYTTSIKINDFTDSVRCEVLSIDGVHRFVRRLTHKMVDGIAEESLIILDLGSNQIGDKGAQYLANALVRNKTLATLNLSFNRIGYQGAQHLANALRHNTTLVTLNLNKNRVQEQGAEYLADALQYNTTLTTLNVDEDASGYCVAVQAAVKIRNEKTLTTLNVRLNEIGDGGAQYFANALQQNMTLTSLDLYKNQIGEKGAEYIANALRSNTGVVTVNLRFNPIGSNAVQYFVDTLQTNHTLYCIYLDGRTVLQPTQNGYKENEPVK